MNLSEFAVKRPITTLMVILSVVVLGILSVLRLPLTYYPELSGSFLRIQIPYESSSPDEVQRLIAIPVEDIMGTVSHLESLESTSSANGASVILRFKLGTDMDLAAMEVRDRMDRVWNELPADVDRYFVWRWQTSDRPVFEFSVAWDREKSELAEMLQKVIVPRIQRIDGVANVEVQGVDEKEVVIDLDQSLLQTYRIDVRELAQSLRLNNLNVSGGYIYDGGRKFTVRAVGEFRTVAEIAQVPIRGHNLVLGDVADVKYDYPEKKNIQRLNGHEAISVRVYKASTANVVEVAQKVRRLIESLEKEPQLRGLTSQVFRDQSSEIVKSLSSLAYAGLFGGVLAIITLFIFLREVKSTLIIGLAIPVSIIATFFFMYLIRLKPVNSDITINLVSLTGLMFAVGILVDPAVVALENIFRHRQEEGLGPFEAAIFGAKEIGVAVLTASLTTVIVFVPLVFMSNTGMGRWMKDFGVAITTAIIASLLIALTLIPLVASRIFTGKHQPRVTFMKRLNAIYDYLLRFALRFRWVALVVFVAVLVGGYYLYLHIDRDWIPRTPERRMILDVRMPRTYGLEDAKALFDRVEKELLAKKEELEIRTVSTNIRARRGRLDIFFTDQEKARRPTVELYSLVRKALPQIPGVEFRTGRMHGRGGDEIGITVELQGESVDVLQLYAQEVQEMLRDISGIRDVNVSTEVGDEEVQIVVDRTRAQMYGVSSQQVASTVSSALSSRANSRFKTADREVDIRMQLREEDRVNMEQLKTLRLRNQAGEMVSLGTVAGFTMKKGPQQIERKSRQPVVSVYGITDRMGMLTASEVVGQLMADVELPPGYSWSLGESWRRWRQSEQESYFAIALAVVLIYIIMAALFESFVHPFTILLSVPFAAIGILFLFWYTDTNLTNVAYLGAVVASGLVVNNGIILIDYINRLRRGGMSRYEAILKGGHHRLRPILMTTATTIIGLTPLVAPAIFPGFFGPLEGRAAMYAPVGLAVLGGLLTSTPLTLILMPVVYSLLDDLVRWARRVAAAV
jgi:HAE1 family hydrophobic/amphiphilic exporter-1